MTTSIVTSLKALLSEATKTNAIHLATVLVRLEPESDHEAAYDDVLGFWQTEFEALNEAQVTMLFYIICGVSKNIIEGHRLLIDICLPLLVSPHLTLHGPGIYNKNHFDGVFILIIPLLYLYYLALQQICALLKVDLKFRDSVLTLVTELFTETIKQCQSRSQQCELTSPDTTGPLL